MDKSMPRTTKKLTPRTKFASESTRRTVKETKTDLVRSSFRQLHDTLQRGSRETKKKRTDDGISVSHVFYVHGSILLYPGNIAHFVSSDMQMGKNKHLSLTNTIPI